MPLEFHTVESPDGLAPVLSDRIVLGMLNGVANAAGGGAGAAVTTAVSVPAGNLPANYQVHVTPSQAAMVSVTGKTNTGFNVVLTPLPAVTLTSGTFDVLVVA